MKNKLQLYKQYTIIRIRIRIRIEYKIIKKENLISWIFFSWDQYYTEMMKNFEQLLQAASQAAADPASNKPNPPVSRSWHDSPTMLLACNQKDPRNFRPFAVKLSLAIHNINGHLALDLAEGVGSVPLPIGFTDRIALELTKEFKETKLQLFVDPVNIFIEDLMPREYDRNLYQGKFMWFIFFKSFIEKNFSNL